MMESITFNFVPCWRHQTETFFTILAICAGNSPFTDEFPHKGQWRGALMFSLTCAWIIGWVNNGEAGDFRRHRAHYDVTVMHQQAAGIEMTDLVTLLHCDQVLFASQLGQLIRMKM